MNQAKFSEFTKLALVHLKSYNYKLCRKGLLERGMQMKIYFGDFSLLEDRFLKDSFNQYSCREDLKKKLEEKKALIVQKELGKLKTALVALDRTISNIKRDVQSLVKEETYNAWLKRVTVISNRFKCQYSEINNDLYNHLYKANRTTESALNCIIVDSHWINKNICDSHKDIRELVLDFNETDIETDIGTLFSDEMEQKSGKRKSETEARTPEKKRKQSEEKSESITEDRVEKRTANSNVDGLDPVSTEEFSEDESEILNEIVTVVDEVGEVNLSDFMDNLYQATDL